MVIIWQYINESNQHIFFWFFKILFIFRRRKGGRNRGRETWMYGCLLLTPFWGRVHNPGMCPRPANQRILYFKLHNAICLLYINKDTEIISIKNSCEFHILHHVIISNNISIIYQAIQLRFQENKSCFLCLKSGVSHSFSPGATSASRLPSKGWM